MGDEQLAASGLGDRRAERLPIGMVGDDERQLDALLPGAGADPHPARGEGDDRVGEFSCPEILQRARRTDDDLPAELAALLGADLANLAERDALAFVIGREALQRAVDVDRPLVAGRA